MDNRFADFAIVAGLDAGHQNLPWDPGQASGLLAGVDLKSIMRDPQAAEIIPLLPVQALYYALKRQGFEESLDVLALLSQDQVTRMVDYDVWSHDELVPQKLFRFLKPFGEVSKELLYERFSSLDEEYQLAALQGMLRVYEAESVMDLTDELQERVRAMPCGTVFYEVISDNEEDIEFVDALMDACKESQLSYAYALLGYASYMPPAEQELQIIQFRKARLEEDGFVSFEDSQDLFVPFDIEALRAKWSSGDGEHKNLSLASQGDPNLSFLDRVLELARIQGTDIDELYRLHQAFLYLANALCAAARVEPDDASGIHRLFEQAKALVSLGLEYLARGQVEKGALILRGEAAKMLFKVGISLVDGLRQEVVQRLSRLRLPGSEALERAYLRGQWGKILLDIERNWTERVGLEASEILKGLFNRFPMYPVQEAEGKILFRPIDGLDAFQELEVSLATILGTFACVVRSGYPLEQSFEIILREAAIQSLAEGSQGSYLNLEEAIPQLLDAWRDGLISQLDSWYVGDRAQLEDVLGLIMRGVHDGLHGLVILPRHTAKTTDANDEERI